MLYNNAHVSLYSQGIQAKQFFVWGINGSLARLAHVQAGRMQTTVRVFYNDSLDYCGTHKLTHSFHGLL